MTPLDGSGDTDRHMGAHLVAAGSGIPPLEQLAREANQRVDATLEALRRELHYARASLAAARAELERVDLLMASPEAAADPEMADQLAHNRLFALTKLRTAEESPPLIEAAMKAQSRERNAVVERTVTAQLTREQHQLDERIAIDRQSLARTEAAHAAAVAAVDDIRARIKGSEFAAEADSYGPALARARDRVRDLAGQFAADRHQLERLQRQRRDLR